MAEAATLAPGQTPEDLELNAFLDRIQGRNGPELTTPYEFLPPILQGDGLQQAFAEASLERTPDEIDLCVSGPDGQL